MASSRDQALVIAMSAVEKCSQRVAQFMTGEIQAEAMQKLYCIMTGFCMLEDRAAATDLSLEAASSMLQADEEISFQQAFDQQMDQRMSQVRDMTKHPKYIKFDKTVKAILAEANNDIGDGAGNGNGSDDDAELMVTEAEINTIDPISQQVMVSPVKNKICGHAYEKDSIINMLLIKKRMRCPYVGCPNRGHFNASDLEEDSRLKQILKRQRTK